MTAYTVLYVGLDISGDNSVYSSTEQFSVPELSQDQH